MNTPVTNLADLQSLSSSQGASRATLSPDSAPQAPIVSRVTPSQPDLRSPPSARPSVTAPVSSAPNRLKDSSTAERFLSMLPAETVPTLEQLVEQFDFSTTVGADDNFTGTLASRAILVLGVVHGNIECKGPVFILNNGAVFGNITTPQLWIFGEVGDPTQNPPIIDAGVVHIGETAKVFANVTYDVISITKNRGISGQITCRSHAPQNA